MENIKNIKELNQRILVLETLAVEQRKTLSLQYSNSFNDLSFLSRIKNSLLLMGVVNMVYNYFKHKFEEKPSRIKKSVFTSLSFFVFNNLDALTTVKDYIYKQYNKIKKIKKTNGKFTLFCSSSFCDFLGFRVFCLQSRRYHSCIINYRYYRGVTSGNFGQTNEEVIKNYWD